MHPPPDIDDPRYVKAMSHPVRVRILALLQERAASPVELARWLDATVGTVAYHVRTLRALGLIELVAETRVRGGLVHHYRARVGPLVSPKAWADASPVAKQAAVGASLDTIADYAAPPRRRADSTRRPHTWRGCRFGSTRGLAGGKRRMPGAAWPVEGHRRGGPRAARRRSASPWRAGRERGATAFRIGASNRLDWLKSL